MKLRLNRNLFLEGNAMKKIVSLMMVVAMVCGLLSACGGISDS
jgi:hypothetical protein